MRAAPCPGRPANPPDRRTRFRRPPVSSTTLPQHHDAPAANFERVPPQDVDAEQSVLGGMLLSKDAIGDVVDNVKLRGPDFYRPAHETIYGAILDVHAKGEPADPITIAAELTKRGEIARVGGASYLHTLVQSVPTAANAEYYAEIVHERAVLRRLVEAGTRITQMGYAAQGELNEIVADAAQEIAGVAEGADTEEGTFSLPSEHVDDLLKEIEDTQHGKDLTGVKTGYTDLDMLTGGLQPGQLILIAGRPGMGKSTAAMDIARQCAIKDGRPCAFLSLEMPTHELGKRVLSAEGKIGLHKIRNGGMDEADWKKLATASQCYREAPLHINDASQSLADIQSELRRLKRTEPDLALVVVDYMQLVRIAGRSRPQVREQEVAEISRSFKLLAKELNLPIIVLAQLNRGPEMRADKKPALSDLRESGSQEQDADIVILLNRPDAYEKESPRSGEVDLIVAKHRNGPTAEITVAAQLHYSRFVDMAQT
ncbi:replicative DNA helicase [Streptomyces benahoarensis]|uniref:replicative DNA helicase n=1 Tax=Streptomyces benahoarensis TaxID=2595054 RepID=UPI003D8045F0